MERKLLITGLCEGSLGASFAEAAEEWGAELVPATLGVFNSSHSFERLLMFFGGALEPIEDNLPIHPRDFALEALEKWVDQDTILVNASERSYSPLFVERFGGLGAPIILLSPFGFPKGDIECRRLQTAIENHQEKVPISVLQAHGFSTQSQAILSGVRELKDSLLGAEVRIEESIGSVQGIGHSALAEQLIRAHEQVGVYRPSIDDIPLEYRHSHHRLRVSIRRPGGDQEFKMDLRGHQVQVEDFYQILLPRFNEMLDGEHVPGGPGLGLVEP